MSQKKNATVSLSLDLIDPSPTNPRKTFDEQKLQELAASIKEKGLLQEVTVRPKGERFELVFGERRWRAAQIAGLAEIEVKVRDFTDAQVIELQIIENCQRDDVPPLEEAEGFKMLHELHSYSVQDLVSKTGRTEKYVRSRLKLTGLPANAREALSQGRIVLGVAELVSLLPTELQEKAAADVIEGDRFSGAPLTIADARHLLLERYTLQLAKAPFDTKDADLYPEAGPCSTCPKRTGNQGVLFSDVASPDVCTDPNCFAEKKERVRKLSVTKAKDQGQEVMTKKEAKQVFGISGQVSGTSGYVELSDRCEADPKGRTFKKLLGSKLPSVTIARDEAGRVRELVKATEVHDALAAAGHKIELPEPPAVQDPEEAKEERRKAQERERKKRELIEATIPLAVEQLVEKWEKREPSKALWRFIATILLESSNGAARGRRREQLGETRDDAPKALEKMTEAQLKALVIELALEGDLYESWGGKYTEGMREVCDLMKVDLKELEKGARKQLSQAAEQKEPAADASAEAEQGSNAA